MAYVRAAAWICGQPEAPTRSLKYDALILECDVTPDMALIASVDLRSRSVGQLLLNAKYLIGFHL